MNTAYTAYNTAYKRQGGMTLVEMMVAIAVGLGVVLLAGRLFGAANGAYAAQTDSAGLDDGGRYALELIGHALRQAAHVDLAQLDLAAPGAPAVPARLAGLDAHSLGRTTPGLDEPLPDVANGSDILAVRFPGAGTGNGDGSVTDCAGFPVGANEEGWSIFYVAQNANGDAELRCKYKGASGWSADAVVASVDGFQVLYGLDTDSPRDGVANRYVNADAIRALDTALAATGLSPQELQRQSWWKRVASVRVALLLHGARATRDTPGTRDYQLFGPLHAQDAADEDQGTVVHEAELAPELRRRERRLFSSTVALPAAPL